MVMIYWILQGARQSSSDQHTTFLGTSEAITVHADSLLGWSYAGMHQPGPSPRCNDGRVCSSIGRADHGQYSKRYHNVTKHLLWADPTRTFCENRLSLHSLLLCVKRFSLHISANYLPQVGNCGACSFKLIRVDEFNSELHRQGEACDCTSMWASYPHATRGKCGDAAWPPVRMGSGRQTPPARIDSNRHTMTAMFPEIGQSSVAPAASQQIQLTFCRMPKI